MPEFPPIDGWLVYRHDGFGRIFLDHAYVVPDEPDPANLRPDEQYVRVEVRD